MSFKRNAMIALSYTFTTHSAPDVIWHISQATEDDLVVFDVDEVLIAPKDKFLRPSANSLSLRVYADTFFNEKDELNKERYGEWVSQFKIEPVNVELIQAIHALQAKRIKCIALTRMYPGVGPCGKIEAMEDKRVDDLKAIGVDFRGVFPKRVELDFAPREGYTPLFQDGILYSRPYFKGEVLVAFLNKMDLHPRKIWFIDNEELQVQIVGKSVAETSSAYCGIHYLDQSLVNEPFDVTIGEYQFAHFIETNEWLDDEAATKACAKLSVS